MDLAGGVIAITQVVCSAVKASLTIRKLWKDVKEVPEQIQELLEHLELYEPLLNDIDSQLSSDTLPKEIWNSSSAKISLTYCREALTCLSTMANDMSREVAAKRSLKKNIASTKVVLRKDSIQRLERKLKKALKMLDLSIGCYKMALSRVSHEAVMKTLTQVSELDAKVEIFQTSTTIKRQSEDNEGEETFAYQESWALRVGTNRPEPQRRRLLKSGFFGGFWFDASPQGRWTRASFQLPSWLAQTIWEVESRKAYTGWDFHVRSYSVRPSNSPIFKYAARGNIAKMKEIFDSNQASLYDRTEDGHTLLNRTVGTNQVRATEWLLLHGLGTMVDEGPVDFSGSPRQIAYSWDWDTPPEGYHGGREKSELQDKLAIWDLLEKASPEAILEKEGMAMLLERRLPEGYNGRPEFLERFQKQYVPKYHKATLKTRLMVARNFTPLKAEDSSTFERYLSEDFEYLINQDRQITPEDVRDSIKEGISLIHTIAMNFAIEEVIKVQRPFNHQYYFLFWSRVAEKVAAMSRPDELSVAEEVKMPRHGREWTGTPLVSLLNGCTLTDFPVVRTWHKAEPWSGVIDSVLRLWLESLDCEGVDLEVYGRNEKEWFDKSLALQTGSIHLCIEGEPSEMLSPLLVRLAGLEVGPRPSDWSLKWESDEVQNMREFWDGIERDVCPPPPETRSTMPGTWID